MKWACSVASVVFFQLLGHVALARTVHDRTATIVQFPSGHVAEIDSANDEGRVH